VSPRKSRIVKDAELAAANAAEKAGVWVADLNEPSVFRAASTLFAEIWGTEERNQQMPAEIMRALVHAGGYASGAFVDGRMIGALVGLIGLGDGEAFVHSHILGVLPGSDARGAGFALKQHQRAWTLGRGLTRVEWTFDPLVRRNAYFNLCKLGAAAPAYYENFYGVMEDAINAGDLSDRLLIRWDLASDRAERAAEGRAIVMDVSDLIGNPDAVALGVAPDGSPLASTAPSEVRICATPEDIVALRATNPDLARDWRAALRAALGGAIADGLEVSGFSRDGCYVLARQPG
jgi:predicted GNAT superfamily acetyltransferase